MILAREFRVAPNQVASWSYADFYSALQLLTEERLGKAMRAHKREEDEQVRKAMEALR